MNLLEIVLKGGWVMIPIILSSIAVVAIAISRYLTISNERKILSQFASEWGNRSIDSAGYRTACKLGSALTNELAALFELDRKGSPVRLTEIEMVARRELARLETGLGALATLAAIAPLLGFLGTVTGMMRAFMQIQNLGGAVNAAVLAGGIWEALTTTVAGLVVGIPALVLYNWLAAMVKDSAGLMEKIGAITIRQMGGSVES